MRHPDRRVSERLTSSRDIRLTWNQAQAELDLAELNARMGGRFSRGQGLRLCSRGKEEEEKR